MNTNTNWRKTLELRLGDQGLGQRARSAARVSRVEPLAGQDHLASPPVPVLGGAKAQRTPSPPVDSWWHQSPARGRQQVMLWVMLLGLVRWAHSAAPEAETARGRLEGAMEVRNLDRENPFADDWIRKGLASLQSIGKDLAEHERGTSEAGAAVIKVMNAYINDPNSTNQALVSREIVVRAGEIVAHCEAVTRGETNFQNALRQLRTQLQARVEDAARRNEAMEGNLSRLRREHEQVRQAVQDARKDLEAQGYLSGAKALEPERTEHLAQLVVAYQEREVELQIQEESLARCRAHQDTLIHVDAQFADAERASRLKGLRASSAARLARLVGEAERNTIGQQLDLLGIEDAAGFAVDFTRGAAAGFNWAEVGALLGRVNPSAAERTNAVSIAVRRGQDQDLLGFFKNFEHGKDTHE